eukprot:11806170-Alexandrium_andersonii.AAC.1
MRLSSIADMTAHTNPVVKKRVARHRPDGHSCDQSLAKMAKRLFPGLGIRKTQLNIPNRAFRAYGK